MLDGCIAPETKVVALQTANIGINSRTIGELNVDPNEVRGSGGALGPMLAVPLHFELRTRQTTQLAMTGVRVELWLKRSSSPPVRVGTPSVHSWLSDPLVSHDSFPSDRRAEATFDLSLEYIRLIENSVEQTEYLPLELSVAVDLAVVAERNVSDGRDETGWAYRFVEPDRMHEIRLYVERSHWADRVLPQIGADRVRLAAVRLGDPWAARKVIAFLDAARRDYDNGRYRECLQKCRDVRHEIERLLQANRKKVGERVADRLAQAGLIHGDSTQWRFLDGVWGATAGLTSDAHHIASVVFTAREARAALLITAVLVEFVSELDPLRDKA